MREIYGIYYLITVIIKLLSVYFWAHLVCGGVFVGPKYDIVGPSVCPTPQTLTSVVQIYLAQGLVRQTLEKETTTITDQILINFGFDRG